jgi:anti-sigma B factor antagonist
MMDITVNEHHRVDVVGVQGSVNSETAPKLDAALNERLNKGSNLVVDLAGVDYMSSAGLRALVAALKRARTDGGNLVISAPSARVREVMDLAGLTDVFPIFDEQVGAVGSF